MSNLLSRTEALSNMGLPTIPANQLIGDPIIDIFIDNNNMDIVVAFAKSGEKRISRTANTVPQSSVVSVSQAGYNANHELVVVLTNNETYNFGKLTGPDNYTGAIGTGLLSGMENGHPKFKPLVGGGDITINSNTITLTGAVDPDQSFSYYARFYEKTRFTATPPANTWYNRTLRESYIALAGASVNNSVITLPAGTYYAQGWAVSYRTNTFCARLFNTLNSQVLLNGMPSMARVGSGYNSETYSRFRGRFVLSQTATIVLQAFCSVPFSEHSITLTGNHVEIWRLK